MLRYGASVGLVLLLAACGGRSLYFDPDGEPPPNPDGGPPPLPDGAVPPDAGPFVCEEGDSWGLEPVPIETLFAPLAMLSAGVPQGVTVRVRAMAAVGGCDRFAGVRPEVDPLGETVTLHAYVWRYYGPGLCPGDLYLAPEWLDFGFLDPGLWTFTDGYPTSGPVPTTGVFVRACGGAGDDCFCLLWDGIPGQTGDACTYDCQCEGWLGCLWEGAPGPGAQGACYATCSVDADCPLPMTCAIDPEPGQPEGVCVKEREPCLSDAECLSGWACLPFEDLGSYCQPAMDDSRRWSTCEDECDCAPGLICTFSPIAELPTCQIPCRGPGDCPAHLQCADEDLPDIPGLFVCDQTWDITMLAPVD